MNAWLETWGRVQMPEGSHHSSSDGMMTEEQMQELDEANSAEGQRLFLEGMIRHHQGAIKMAQAEIPSGKNPEAITLAKNIAESQQVEADTMTELLNKIRTCRCDYAGPSLLSGGGAEELARCDEMAGSPHPFLTSELPPTRRRAESLEKPNRTATASAS
jgi:hypothetical protein